MNKGKSNQIVLNLQYGSAISIFSKLMQYRAHFKVIRYNCSFSFYHFIIFRFNKGKEFRHRSCVYSVMVTEYYNNRIKNVFILL